MACPVISSIIDDPAVVIVAEPPLSGHNDMHRVVGLAHHFKIPAYVLINEFDLNAKMTETIEEYARDKGVPIMSRIPFNPTFTKAVVEKKSIIEYDRRSEAVRAVREIWERLRLSLKKTRSKNLLIILDTHPQPG